MGEIVHMTCTVFPSSSSCSESVLQDIRVNHQHHGRSTCLSPSSSQHGDQDHLLHQILIQEEQKLDMTQMGPSGS